MATSSSSVPLTRRRWHSKLTHTFPDWSTYPKSFLTEVEQEFVEWLLERHVGDGVLLRSREEVAEKARFLWRGLLRDKSPKSLAVNFHSGKSYLNREYRVGKRKVGLWLFDKGLLFKYRVPTVRASFKYEYCYPCFSGVPVRLRGSGFEVKFPPHSYFSAMIVNAFRAGVSDGVLQQLPQNRRVVPHFDGGEYVSDLVYRLDLFGKKNTFWVEVHTGSEGYDQKVFLRRLVTMSQFLAGRSADFFVVIVPFVRDVTTGLASLTKYNEDVRLGVRSSPGISLEKVKLLSFNQISNLKESFGFYRHSTR
ncbi:MAG: hypothetical protein ACTSSK_03295 [Candidatus Heimdallarchaeota archaeon]